MPCRDGGPSAGEIAMSDLKRQTQIALALSIKCDDLTKNLCSACRKMNKAKVDLGPEIAAWWEEHQKSEGHETDMDMDEAAADLVGFVKDLEEL